MPVEIIQPNSCIKISNYKKLIDDHEFCLGEVFIDWTIIFLAMIRYPIDLTFVLLFSNFVPIQQNRHLSEYPHV